jgi:hypothetical protein
VDRQQRHATCASGAGNADCNHTSNNTSNNTRNNTRNKPGSGTNSPGGTRG